jgi:triosephosphate isomerase
MLHNGPSIAWRVLLLICMALILNTVVATAPLPTEHVQKIQKKFLGANWKCSLETTEEVDELIDDLNRMWGSLSSSEQSAVELCVNPPFVFVDRVRSRLTKDISVGSQNVFDARGPNRGNTGATTTKMLRAVGCDWVLLGHSDRRNSLGETDQLISDKVRLALEAGMGVTLTIGELQTQRQWGRALATLRKQLRVASKSIKADEWHRIVVAYEPVWAVGEGATPCSPEEAQRINAALRAFIRKRVSADAAAACRLTYTGSVNEENAAAYASLADVDGFVVGRAGLDTTKLRSIIRTLARNNDSLA